MIERPARYRNAVVPHIDVGGASDAIAFYCSMAPIPPACDPFGHVWVLLTWKEDLEPAEMERRGNALLNRTSAKDKLHE
jgi:hypothetical protein